MFCFRSIHQIHEKTWISRKEQNSDHQEYRDIRVDYPGIENVLDQEELGYKKSKRINFYRIEMFS